ncbi:hypothetical protein A1O3_00421 [Capronia epimyces CBS 606.96]|uniref:Transcription factor domain-containing protein n=1 Tax=Capronia epimyces CBS 606.96 TaxID=1182542 RepID=W9YRL9_9EURO|nr:uncharacterized protein A1O3_00421 [Capronia epimyces CBS 606.96]EXJ91871.1 hypothetical protein A1O3_00421 [Capronia epimyces CBS 606.96]
MAFDVTIEITLDKGFTSSSNDDQNQKLDLLLERLSQFEERISQLEASSHESDGQAEVSWSTWRDLDTPSARHTSPDTATATAARSDAAQMPQYQVEDDDLQEDIAEMQSQDINAYYNESSDHMGNRTPGHILFNDSKRAQYMEKSPLECEESRSPIPDVLSETEPTSVSVMMPFVQDFLDRLFDVYPITCKDTVERMVGWVKSHGFQDDVPSCFTLLIVALSKAYRSYAPVDSGLADFQRATQILSRLSSRSSLEYVIVQVMSALFLLKIGRLVNFTNTLHTACAALFTLIRR